MRWPAELDLPGRMEHLVIAMYETGILELEDVYLMQAWLRDLQHLGYAFPPILSAAPRPPVPPPLTILTFDACTPEAVNRTFFSTRLNASTAIQAGKAVQLKDLKWLLYTRQSYF